jgi:predicted outer membrane repeat protein
VVSNNSVVDGSGGGIYSDGGTVSVTTSTIHGNHANGGSGGGINASGDWLLVDHSTVDGNTATGDGGGIYATTKDTGTNAGSIGNDGSFILDSTIGNNSAQSFGGGVAFESTGALTVISTTIAMNNAQYGGGVYQTSTGTVELGNTILAGNVALSIPNGPDAYGTFTDLGHNLIGISDGSTGFTVSTLVGSGIAPVLAKLSPLGLHGGTTATYALLPGSLALHSGDVSLDNTYGITTDQAGNPRFTGGLVDIGSLES